MSLTSYVTKGFSQKPSKLKQQLLSVASQNSFLHPSLLLNKRLYSCDTQQITLQSNGSEHFSEKRKKKVWFQDVTEKVLWRLSLVTCYFCVCVCKPPLILKRTVIFTTNNILQKMTVRFIEILKTYIIMGHESLICHQKVAEGLICICY